MPSPDALATKEESPHPPTSPRKARSRSRSPRRDSDRPLKHHSRSRDAEPERDRSPPRRPKSTNYSGFKWKQKPKRDEEDRSDDRGLNRGYQAQERREHRDRDRRDRDRDADRDRDREGRYGRNRDDRPSDRDRDRDRRDQNRHRDRFSGNQDSIERRRDRDRDRDDRRRNPDSGPTAVSKPVPKTVAAPASGEPMIIVTVNDRLGTKAQIPCLASDPVKVFKAMVAARVGRPAHEIMLKRQGERPFKDHLSLEDYGVSNGVQLDLELDTGD